MVRDPQRRIPIGISSCLLGHPVRYDGGHKRDVCVILRSQPMMPVEEEDHLHDPCLRDSFVERVYAFHRLQRSALPANRTTNRM